MIGKPSIAVLQRTQEFANMAVAILSNRQSTQSGLEAEEQVVNFQISQVQVSSQTPTTLVWTIDIQFRNGSFVQLTIG